MSEITRVSSSDQKGLTKSVPYRFYLGVKNLARKIDLKIEAPLKFFIKHFGKTPFMVAMSKKLQVHGIEKVFKMGPKAFFYFFMFYLIRDTILYIILPIYFARMTGE